MKTLACCLLLLLGGSGFAKDELFGIPEIPVPSLGDIAIAAYDTAGNPVIFFNPTIVARCDPLVIKFIRAHEYAHHRLGHLQKRMFAQNPYALITMDRANETAADKFATAYWKTNDARVIGAFIAAMRDPTKANMGDWTHLPSPERARLIEKWSNPEEKISAEKEPDKKPEESSDKKPSTDPVLEITAEIATLLKDSDYDGVHGKLSTSLQSQLSTQMIEATMNRMNGQVGSITKVGKAAKKTAAAHTTGECLCTTDSGKLLVQVQFNSDDEVVGLFVYPRR